MKKINKIEQITNMTKQQLNRMEAEQHGNRAKQSLNGIESIYVEPNRIGA